MKTLILIVVLFLLPITVLGKRTISGRITDKNDNPIANARVRAYDSDALSGDDLMGETFTNVNGYYSMTYEGKRWDTKWPFLNTWRPNIFIRVSVRVNGRCDDGEWNESANWRRLLPDSRVFSNHKMRKDLIINLKTNNYPENISIASFTECENMVCSQKFFFYYKCSGSYQGKKIEWSGWGSLPYKETRCTDLEKEPNWTDRDTDEMRRECNNRILDVTGAGSGATALTQICQGPLCNSIEFKATQENAILVKNNSEESVTLDFKCKPFKKGKKMKIVLFMKPNDSLLIPAIKYKRFKVKRN
jgi:hypothetical protein